MNEISFYQSAYKSNKDISLQDIPTAKATGFNASADDYMERGIDLNEQLVKNKPATFFFRMNSDAMIGAGMMCNDILIVDRSVAAVSGKIIIAALDGELIVRRLQKTGNTITLHPANKIYSSLSITESSSYIVWGVVTYIIHSV